MQEALATIEAGGSRSAAGQVIIRSFNLIIEPDSVVREGEYALTERGLSLRDRGRGLIERATKGGPGNVPLSELRNMVRLAETFNREQDAYIAGQLRRIEGQSDHFQLPTHLIIPEQEEYQRPAPGGTVAPRKNPFRPN